MPTVYYYNRYKIIIIFFTLQHFKVINITFNDLNKSFFSEWKSKKILVNWKRSYIIYILFVLKCVNLDLKKKEKKKKQQKRQKLIRFLNEVFWIEGKKIREIFFWRKRTKQKKKKKTFIFFSFISIYKKLKKWKVFHLEEKNNFSYFHIQGSARINIE